MKGLIILLAVLLLMVGLLAGAYTVWLFIQMQHTGDAGIVLLPIASVTTLITICALGFAGVIGAVFTRSDP